MKPSFAAAAAAAAVIISLLFTGVQGIRFKRGLFSFVGLHHETIHEERSDSLMKTSDGDGSSSTAGAGVVVVCKDCKSRGSMNRKLISTSTATTITFSTTTSKNEGNHPASSTLEEQLQAGDFSPPTSGYVDLTDDITEMDYSPAKRKPPIHN